MMKKQQGATMIIVLIVLLLVAVAGTIALRSGVFGMRLSTNSQVGNLLIQNNDAALLKFEDMDAVAIQQNFALGGVYHYLLDPANATDELVFCYDAKTPDTFNANNYSIINDDGTTDRTTFCNIDKFSSERHAVITQVHMRRNPAEERVPEGRTLNSSTMTVQKNINLSLVAVSITPAFGTSNATNINDCFKKSAFTSTGKITECFTNLGVPHDVQSTDFEAGNTISVENY